MYLFKLTSISITNRLSRNVMRANPVSLWAAASAFCVSSRSCASSRSCSFSRASRSSSERRFLSQFSNIVLASLGLIPRLPLGFSNINSDWFHPSTPVNSTYRNKNARRGQCLVSRTTAMWLYLWNTGAVCRTAEDYAVVYFGASIFKVTRLLVVAISSVHFFACAFFKVSDSYPHSPQNLTQSLHKQIVLHGLYMF